tara:strand:- start:3457 stop:3942 length:486 start_codon:yes stop_codon:yes gene_type:complete
MKKLFKVTTDKYVLISSSIKDLIELSNLYILEIDKDGVLKDYRKNHIKIRIFRKDNIKQYLLTYPEYYTFDIIDACIYFGYTSEKDRKKMEKKNKSFFYINPSYTNKLTNESKILKSYTTINAEKYKKYSNTQMLQTNYQNSKYQKLIKLPKLPELPSLIC